MIAADSRLRVSLQLVKRYADALAVRLAYPMITTNERGKRNRFGCRKCSVPARSVLHCLDGFPVLILVFVRNAVLNKLLTCLRVLPLAQLGEIFRHSPHRPSRIA